MLQAILGGVLIGVAATVLLAGNGRLAGNSGMLHRLLPPQPGDAMWRILYLLGLVLGAGLYAWLQPQPAAAAAARAAHPLAVLLGGVIVGVGTRLGGGCTSGHGVCGIARLSLRSFVATLIFMVVGMLTVAVIRHLIP
ncbi:MAG: YeeE/YedE family protein [Candidatus Omnitrophica bacterium CG11_big_fil_rev_8_21_14_0_20_63_9]|nr:MAG: YeeE/YedE family protein [Candidatus Omnitrophica bacterium CG11_big_fil_rev_8_21_14_0_20_63_9]